MNMKKIKLGVICAGCTVLMMHATHAWTAGATDQSVVLLKYKNAVITKADLNAEIQRIPEAHRMEVLASKSRVWQILENMLLNRAFAQDARSEGLDKNEAIQNEIRLAEDRILAREYLDRRVKAISLPDFEKRARELYKANPDKYTLPPLVDVSHILIEIKDGDVTNALERATSIYNQLVAGSDFETLAKNNSDDKSVSMNAGRLGYITADKVVTEFGEAAFALENAGDISKPVKSKFGYHVIKLHDKKNGGLQDFSAVKDGIVENMKLEYLAGVRKDMINVVRGASDLQVNQEELEKIKSVIPAPDKLIDGDTSNQIRN